uniref:Uncharacterized protein n=1 Tax=Glossina palpalis gambiensis TaxID=67801 RepID=A0A1B0B0G5_9MUSC
MKTKVMIIGRGLLTSCVTDLHSFTVALLLLLPYTAAVTIQSGLLFSGCCVLSHIEFNAYRA